MHKNPLDPWFAAAMIASMLFGTPACAQIASSSGFEITGNVTINGHSNDYDQLRLENADVDLYDQTVAMEHFDDGVLRFSVARTRTFWTGLPAPYTVQASSALNDWELHFNNVGTTFFELSVPTLSGYAQVNGTCPSDLLSTTFLDVSQIKLYINGEYIFPPYFPDENTVTDLTTDNKMGASDGNMILRETTRTASGITMIGIDLNVTFAEADGTMAAINVQVAQNAANLDCSVPVELQSWEVE